MFIRETRDKLRYLRRHEAEEAQRRPTVTHCAPAELPDRRYRPHGVIDSADREQSKTYPDMKAAKMLTWASAGMIVDTKSMTSRKLLHHAMTLRIAALAICLFAVSNSAHAQNAAASALSDSGAEPATASLEEKYAALEAANVELEGRVAELEKVNRDLESKAAQLQRTVLITNTAGRRLSSSLARRIPKSVSRHVSTMAGTSIPYIGVGVLVAMTALDIKDGCESLRDLNEMNRAMGLEREDESQVCAMQVPTREEVIAQVINNWRTAYVNAAAWANQYEARLPPDPPRVSYPHAGELWMAVFGSNPKAVPQTLPMQPTVPTLPILPTLPTIKRPLN